MSRPRSTLQYLAISIAPDRWWQPWLLEIRSLARQRPRLETEPIVRSVVERHWHVSHRRGDRLEQQENLKVWRKQFFWPRLSGVNENSCVRHWAQYMDLFGRYDFLTNPIEDDRPLWLLAVIEEATSECQANELESSFKFLDMFGVPQHFFQSAAHRITSVSGQCCASVSVDRSSRLKQSATDLTGPTEDVVRCPGKPSVK